MKLYLTSLKLTGLLHLIDHEPSDTKVLFIPTAANVYQDKWFMEADQNWFKDNHFQVSEFDLVNKSRSDIGTALASVDIVYLSGGNTFYLLDHIKKSSFDTVLKDQLKRELVYAGGSAGAVVAGMSIEPAKEFDDPHEAPELSNYDGMQLIKLSILPHYGNPKYQDLYQKALESTTDTAPILTLTDSQALVVKDNHYQIIEV